MCCAVDTEGGTPGSPSGWRWHSVTIEHVGGNPSHHRPWLTWLTLTPFLLREIRDDWVSALRVCSLPRPLWGVLRRLRPFRSLLVAFPASLLPPVAVAVGRPAPRARHSGTQPAQLCTYSRPDDDS